MRYYLALLIVLMAAVAIGIDNHIGYAQVTDDDYDDFCDDDSAKFIALAEADTDKDKIPDVLDSCPTQAETVNGYLDFDGCPDRIPTTNNTKAPIEIQGQQQEVQEIKDGVDEATLELYKWLLENDPLVAAELAKKIEEIRE